jgi:hypothetical protein
MTVIYEHQIYFNIDLIKSLLYLLTMKKISFFLCLSFLSSCASYYYKDSFQTLQNPSIFMKKDTKNIKKSLKIEFVSDVDKKYDLKEDVFAALGINDLSIQSPWQITKIHLLEYSRAPSCNMGLFIPFITLGIIPLYSPTLEMKLEVHLLNSETSEAKILKMHPQAAFAMGGLFSVKAWLQDDWYKVKDNPFENAHDYFHKYFRSHLQNNIEN